MDLVNYDPSIHFLLKAIPEIADAGCAADHIHHLTQARRPSLSPPMEPARPGVLRGVTIGEAKTAAETLLAYLKQACEQGDAVGAINWDTNGGLSEAGWELCEREAVLLGEMKVLLEKTFVTP
jgi:hypothetical protein